MSMPGAPTVPCKYCKRAIDSDATKCPECQSDLRRKSWFNLEGWSKLIGFLIALTTVVSLGSDKLSALYLVLTGQDGAVINLEFTDARFSEAKADGEPAELKSAVGTVSNSGRGQGVLFAQVVCLGEDLAAGDAGKREVLVGLPGRCAGVDRRGQALLRGVPVQWPQPIRLSVAGERARKLEMEEVQPSIPEIHLQVQLR